MLSGGLLALNGQPKHMAPNISVTWFPISCMTRASSAETLKPRMLVKFSDTRKISEYFDAGLR